MKRVALMSAGLLVLVGCSPSQDNVQVPEGTSMTLELETSVRSDMNVEGDPIVARTVEPLVIEGRTIVAGGVKVYGEVESMEDGDIDEPARITLVFNEFENAAGQREDVDVKPFVLVGLGSSPTHRGDAPGAMGSDDLETHYDDRQSGQLTERADPSTDTYADHRNANDPKMGSTKVLKARYGTEEVQVSADPFHGIELAPGQQLLVVLEESELPVLAAAIR